MLYRPRLDGNEWVSLSESEIEYAQRTALAMRKLSVSNGHHDYRSKLQKAYDPALAVRLQCLGAVAELAIRKLLGYPMRLTTENYGAADLPDNIEVKLIGREHYGLRIYPRTDDSRRVVGVVIPPGRERHPYRVPGWIRAGDGKKDCWAMAPLGGPKMWAVPQQALRPISELGIGKMKNLEAMLRPWAQVDLFAAHG